MNAALHVKIQQWGWNRAAPYYDRLWADPLSPAQGLMLEVAGIRPGDRVLDICCGSGLVTFPAARLTGPDGEVTGTDISEKMVAAARREAALRGLDHVHFECMDAGELLLPGGEYDVALDALGLMYVADAGKAVAEMYRMLRPGGRAAAVVWGARKECGWADVFPIVDRRVTSDVCPLFFLAGTGHTLARLFTEAGFDGVQERRLTSPVHFAGDDEACDAMFVGGPVALAWKNFDPSMRAEARAEYLESIRPYRTDDGYEIPAEFVIVQGVKRE